jgi:general stress protein YciG
MASKQSGGSEQSQGSKRGGSGNFANDPQRASDAGRRGGEH